MRLFRHIVLLALLLLSLPLRAQWSGQVDLSGAYGYVPARTEEDFALQRYLGQAGFQLKYRAPKFQWNTSLGATFENKSTDSYRFSMSTPDGTERIQADEIHTLRNSIPVSVNLRTSVLWTPAEGVSYESWVLGHISISSGTNVTFKSHYNDIIAEETGQNQLYMEVPSQMDTRLQAGFRSSHRLGSPRRVLKGELTLERDTRKKQGLWIMGELAETDLASFSSYRITPESASQVVGASLHLLDSVITAGPCRLLLDPGIRFVSDFVHDRNSGATYDPATESWRDSTRLRETFDFLAIRVEPYLAADFSWKRIKAHLDYAPQLYARRLTDEIHRQSIQPQQLYLIGNAFLSWQLTPKHRVTLRNTVTVKRPDYIQICWFERQGNYLTQIYRGKESLLSTQTRSYRLEYEFRHKRFLSTTVLGYAGRSNEIDQTFTNEISLTVVIIRYLHG